jgi:LmbE family N-acetylglucosaminyl deacetylase
MELVADRSHLGTPDPILWRIGLPAGRVAQVFDDLGDLLNEIYSFDDICLAPWGHDGHPDHNACGEASPRATISTGADLLKYAVWAWQRARPGPARWTVRRPRKSPRPVAAQERWFPSAFASRIRPLGLDHADYPWLPAPILRPFWGPFEVFGLGGSNK